MSKPSADKIEFHANVAIDREQIKQAKFNIINAKQDTQARELGLLIARTKGWKTHPAGDLHISELDLYVFTRNELKDYVDACIKEKLIIFSERV
jgi:hypothetical protein